ncbi:MAG: hypothetical protein A2583_01540 [Bdellovibrionales bacterium RIFOXYD1_FULL_53_11]|nr:MAG: hypothetical protein A2583_01540 [Bdellovibrionales bacterium RIFOXYD1_FULL_53_11]
MWLLDNNIPRKIHEFLKVQGIPNETASFRGWQSLRNGELVEAAAHAGFRCIVTQDVEFEKSAAKNLQRFPDMAIVLIRIRQLPGRLFVELFQEAWKQSPISPNPGKASDWPV